MDVTELLRTTAALVFVLALLGIGLIGLRRLNILQLFKLTGSGLRLDSTLVLDQRHRVVLIQCRDREHLLILGPSTQTLIESAPIKKENPQTAPAPDQDVPSVHNPPKLVVGRS